MGGEAHEGDDLADAGLALEVEPGAEGEDGDDGDGRGRAVEHAHRGPPVEYRKLGLEHLVDHLAQLFEFRHLADEALHQHHVADGVARLFGQFGVLRLHLALGRVGAVGDKGGDRGGHGGEHDEHQGQFPVEEQGQGQQDQQGDKGGQVAAEHGQPELEQPVAAGMHDTEQAAGVGAAVVGQVQAEDMGEVLGQDVQAQPVGEPVGVQGNERAQRDAAHPDQQPDAEDADAVVEGGLGAAGGRLGEQVDGLAEEDGLHERHRRQGEVGQGQGDGQAPHRLEQLQGPVVDLERLEIDHAASLRFAVAAADTPAVSAPPACPPLRLSRSVPVRSGHRRERVSSPGLCSGRCRRGR